MRADLKADTESAVTVLDGSEFHAVIVLGKKEYGTGLSVFAVGLMHEGV